MRVFSPASIPTTRMEPESPPKPCMTPDVGIPYRFWDPRSNPASPDRLTGYRRVYGDRTARRQGTVHRMGCDRWLFRNDATAGYT